jgi:hypothetical protein
VLLAFGRLFLLECAVVLSCLRRSSKALRYGAFRILFCFSRAAFEAQLLLKQKIVVLEAHFKVSRLKHIFRSPFRCRHVELSLLDKGIHSRKSRPATDVIL